MHRFTGFQENVLEEAKQMSGTGTAIQPPGDKPVIINNVIRPFDGKSEVDRQRATEILDYVV